MKEFLGFLFDRSPGPAWTMEIGLGGRWRGYKGIGNSEPSALCVIVPGGGGYRMENGVSVVPVGALGP